MESTRYRARLTPALDLMGDSVPLKDGDRVRHPALPDWGIGQVLSDPVGKSARVFFVGAGEKLISLDHVSLIPVKGSDAAHPLLDNLRLADSSTIRYRSLPHSVAHFLHEYPGGFCGRRFMDEERTYKVAAHELCAGLLSKANLGRLLSTHDYAQATREALRVVNATNLIFPNEKMSLREGLDDAAGQDRFSESLYSVLHGSGSLEERFLGFARVLEAIGAAKWTIASYFLFLYDPDAHIFVKPTVTQNAAEICGFEINYRAELNWRTYDRVHAFARYLRGQLAELEPRDMIDIQSFMWCIAPQ